jgi:glyoxylase-like metal-dependent hydrolase (beta-lactamase superfamily II)/8-oxo-dGTP pyrophosphatase MutT (NUDIX family)
MKAPMNDESLYQHLLHVRGSAALPTPKPPRPSASVILWRRVEGGSAGSIEVYWVRRAEELPFMGGWHAFPGGGLSRRDLEVPVVGVPPGLEEPDGVSHLPEALIHDGPPPQPDLVPGLLACAVRELFEETGVLLVQELLPGEARGPVVSADHLEEARERLLAHEATFAEVVSDLEVTPDVSRLVFAGRWMTPPFAPLRFDNRFFLLEWPRQATFQPAVEGREIVEGEWLPPREAWEQWRRGEVLAAPPILHILKVLAEDGPRRGLPRLLFPREADLGPFRRIELRPGVVMLPLATATLPPATHTNAYLVGGEETVLIDPGCRDGDELRRLEAALVDLARRHGQRVRAIWLTHHHPDHVGGVAAIRRALGVPALAHPATAERLTAAGIRLDGELTDGERIPLAGRRGEPAVTVRVIHTPGHARGHLCFYEEATGSLVAGDMVAGLGTVVIDPPEGDMDEYLGSLEKLRALAPKTLFPAHGPAIKNAKAKLSEYIEHRLWREGKVLAAWEAGRRTAQAMLPEVYDDVPEAAWPLAERQIEAHLERLRRSGRLR